MKNPLIKRIPRELKSDFGKYIVIFLFMVMLVSLISGFLVADISATTTFDAGYEKYNIEYGHLTFDKKPDASLLSQIEEKADIKLYSLYYCENTIEENDKRLRVYAERDEIDRICLMSGNMPSSESDIVIDRLFADNNTIKIGDPITYCGTRFTVSGLAAFSDYSTLFEKNSDMVYNSVDFGVAVIKKEAFSHLPEKRLAYNYAWKYESEPSDEVAEKEKSDKVIDTLTDILTEYDEKIVNAQVDALKEKLEKAGNEYADIYKANAEKKLKEISADIETGTKEYAEILMAEGTAPTADRLSVKTDAFSFGIIEKTVAAMIGGTEPSIPSEKEFMEQYKADIKKPAKNELETELSDFLFSIVENTVQAEIDGTEYTMPDEKEFESEIDKSAILEISDYNPRYSNAAINFAREDMGSDKAMFILFDYIITIVLAFVFAVTTSNTMVSEAGVIGTLRASGYTRGEILRHYLVLPVAVTFIAAIIGNILGYTVLLQYMTAIYYSNFSLAAFEITWSAEAFILTTIVPIIIMLAVNILVIYSKLRNSPLQFLRHELKKKPRKKAIKLNTKIPFKTRFRMRILFQNLPNYIILLVGIIIGSVIVIFGTMFGPLFEDYTKLVTEQKISSYQYILKNKAETTNADAEKFSIESLKTTNENIKTDEIAVFAIADNSKYIHKEIPKGKVLVSNGIADKYNLKAGDTYTLKAPFTSKIYDFTVADEYDYSSALTIFMRNDDFIEMFDKEKDYFTGYLSDTEITDISDDDIYSVMTEDDLDKLTKQFSDSLMGFMKLFTVFGVAIFVLLMYLLSKQIIERNFQSISMCKILGFNNGEIGGLYILSTSIVVILGLLLAIPLCDIILKWAFKSYIYTEMSGYIPYIVRPSCFVIMVVLGVLSYAVVSVFLLLKIKRISKSEALKNVE